VTCFTDKRACTNAIPGKSGNDMLEADSIAAVMARSFDLQQARGWNRFKVGYLVPTFNSAPQKNHSQTCAADSLYFYLMDTRNIRRNFLLILGRE
jgi:hypothetical protein